MVGSCLYQIVCFIVATSLLKFGNSQLNGNEIKKQAFTAVGRGGAIDFSSIMKPGVVGNLGKGKKKKKGKKNAKNRGQEKKEREMAFKKKIEREKELSNETEIAEKEEPSTTIQTTARVTQGTFNLETSLVDTEIPEIITEISTIESTQRGKKCSKQAASVEQISILKWHRKRPPRWNPPGAKYVIQTHLDFYPTNLSCLKPWILTSTDAAGLNIFSHCEAYSLTQQLLQN